MYPASYFVQQFINALNLGSMYALVAIGLTIVYGILRLINFAHGDMMMLGAYVALACLTSLVIFPAAAALLVPMAVIGAVGILVERIAYRPLRGAPEVAMLITSLAVSSFIENTMILTLTAQPRPFRLPPELTQRHTLFDISFTTLDVLIIVLTLALLAGLNAFVTRTNMGIAMRACAENLRVTQLMGINVSHVITIAFAIGAGLSAVAGTMWAGKFGIVEPFMGFLPGLKAFVAAVIGGIGSIPGAVLGGFLLGFAEIFFVAFLPPAFSGYRDAFVFVLLLVVLLVRPSGLLGADRGINRA